MGVRTTVARRPFSLEGCVGDMLFGKGIGLGGGTGSKGSISIGQVGAKRRKTRGLAGKCISMVIEGDVFEDGGVEVSNSGRSALTRALGGRPGDISCKGTFARIISPKHQRVASSEAGGQAGEAGEGRFPLGRRVRKGLCSAAFRFELGAHDEEAVGVPLAHRRVGVGSFGETGIGVGLREGGERDCG